MRLLIVEDDAPTADLVRRALEREGYAVDLVGDGDSALWAVGERPYAAVVLDRMIPSPDGIEVLRRLRDGRNWVPVLLLTARDAVTDRVEGLDAGADDYLIKPFAIAELAARVRALVRRAPTERPLRLTVGELELDPATHQAWRAGEPLALTARAFAVLEYLMRRAGEVVTRADMIEHVWDFAAEGGSNVVDAYVRRVRQVVDEPHDEHLIETVRGVGYRLKAPR
jgi:two-component system OmpR family response regulator